MKEFKCENGIVYKVPDKSCLLCAECTDVFWDYTNGPYMIICGKHNQTDEDMEFVDLGYEGKCPDYKQEEEE